MDGATPAGHGTAMVDAAPAGLVVVDAGGAVREANEHALAMVGHPPRRVIGRSVLEFVHDDDVGFALDLMAAGARHPGAVTGPAQIRYLHASGGVRTAQLWSRNCLGVDGVDGLVLTVVDASLSAELARAARAAVAADPLDETLAHVVRAVEGPPLASPAAVLVVRDGVLAPVGAWPLGSTSVLDDRIAPPDRSAPHTDSGDGAAVTGHDAPWHVARRSRAAVDLTHPDEMPVWLRRICEPRRIAAVWCRPVVTGDRQVAAVVTVWRSRPGRPSVNQARHLDDVVVTTAVVLDLAAHRGSLARAALTDPLTGLGNRARLEQLVAGPDDDVTGVLYVDLDDFAKVNERHGYAAGDEVLVAVADRLRNALRSRDEVLRLGGDEFVVICRAPGSPGGTDVVADRIVGVLSGPYRVSSSAEPVHVSASIGVDSSRPGLRLQQRIDWADEAMYSAKTFGNTWLRRAESAGIERRDPGADRTGG